jgi:hypothetical protein
MINHRGYRASYFISCSIITCLSFTPSIFLTVDPYYNETPTFDEKIVKTYPYPFGDMAREMVMASGMENFINQKIV